MANRPSQRPAEPRAAVVPARPATGQIVASAWGGDMHDRIIFPKGISASGQSISPAAATFINLDIRTTIYGIAAFLGGDNVTLKVPAGMSGLYVVEVAVNLLASTPGTQAYIRIMRNGGTLVGQGANTLQVGSHLCASVTQRFLDLDTCTVQGWLNVAGGTMTVTRITMRRIGDGLASS